MAGLNLGDEDDELVLDDEIAGGSNVSVELCLVGRFLTDQPINFNLMRSRLASVWRPGKGVFMKDIGSGRYIFQFFHEIDLQRVFEGGPWAFGNFPLILHKLKRGEFPLSVPLDYLPFWVQVHDLPAGFLTEGVGRLLGNFIGKFLEYDSTNSSGVWRQYMRIRVGIRVDDPLKRFKKLKHKDGSSFTVKFKYERLNVFCFMCGRLGHSESYCELMFNQATKDSPREWGVHLKAADRRTTGLAGDKWIRSDVDSGNPSSMAAGPRVSHEQPLSEPKRKEAENRAISFPHKDSVTLRDPRPQSSHRLVLHEISNEDFPRDSMISDDSSLIHTDERKRRRGISINEHQSSLALAVFPVRHSEDASDAPLSLSAGSGYGVSREQ
ncbi:uncharacterized protein At4g02000-like [Salvia miltiorrhiza]|uniref:uncharacterized protein At4g02000-like n=1 Tax=Salvia miltiorrhiza TaxID=226208 RepID=UPI0025AC917A|nr:uncharacterized protein At4g02000-like [Salvia miltiorrhiza]